MFSLENTDDRAPRTASRVAWCDLPAATVLVPVWGAVDAMAALALSAGAQGVMLVALRRQYG